MAETYRIFNWRDYPITYIATLVCGLRNNSRVKMAFSGVKIPFETSLNAAIFDRLNFIAWSKTKDAQSGKNKPKSLLETITSEQKEELQAFSTVEEFKAARARIIGGET